MLRRGISKLLRARFSKVGFIRRQFSFSTEIWIFRYARGIGRLKTPPSDKYCICKKLFDHAHLHMWNAVFQVGFANDAETEVAIELCEVLLSPYFNTGYAK